MATTVAFSELDSWLQSQPANTASTPYELNITGLTESDIGKSDDIDTLGWVLRINNRKYVDLSETIIPSIQGFYKETFAYCSNLVKPPVFPEGTTGFSQTFLNCTSLKITPNIPDTVGYLYQAFHNCTNLTTAMFEKKTFTELQITLDTYAFHECRNLTEFYCDSPNNLRTWLNEQYTRSTSNFPNDVANCHFYLYSEIAEIPIESLSDELSALTANTPETPFVIKITELTQGVSGTTIAYVKQKLTANPTKYVDISNTVIPDPYTHTFYSIFSNCTTLVKAPPVPRLTESIEDCFLGCTNLKETPFIPDTVDWMGSAFEGCTALTKINNLPNNVNLNMHWAFKGCSSLTEVELPYPSSSTEIDLREAFSGCTSLTTLKAYRFVNTSNYAQAFKDCNNLTEFYTDTPYDLKSWLTNIRTASTNNFPVAIANCNFYLYSAPNYSEIRIEKLSDDLATLNANTAQTPFNIKTFGNNKYDIKNALTSNLTKYVNLEESGMTSITDLTKEFENCSNLIKSPKLPTITKNMDSCFKGCVNLIELPDIPEEVENLDDAFNGCALVAATFNVPETVTTMKRTFKGCSSIELILNVPGAVTNLTEAFSGCSSLEEIEEFDVPLSVLKTNAENCFYGCTSLTTVGVQGVDPIKEASAWHVMRLNFGQNNVSGKVYDGDKNATTIPQTDIVKGTLTLPVKTDELWFPPSNMSDADVDEVIESVIDTKRTYFNKDVLNPLNKSFVLWKDSQSQFVSNIDFGGSGGSGITVYDTEEEMEQDLPNKQDGDLVGTLSADEGELQDAPLGSVIPYLGTTDPTDGKWLVCDGRDTTGTAIELETHYPSLFMFLGGTNVLPEIFDHSRLSAWETKTISTNSATPTIMDYDGILFIQVYRSGSQVGSNVKLFINGEEYRSSLDTSATNYWTEYITAPVRKGDSVYYTFAGTVDKCGGWFYKSHMIIKAVSSVDMYHVPASEIAQIEQYFDNGLAQLNTWVDVSSDFSVVDSVAWANTPTSSLKVLYNAFQKKLKVWSWYNSTKSASATHAFTLQYDGNNTDIVFDPTTTIAMQTLNKSYLGYDTTTNPDSAPNSNGFECSYNIRTSKQIRLGGFNRNANTAWGANICLVAEISL